MAEIRSKTSGEVADLGKDGVDRVAARLKQERVKDSSRQQVRYARLLYNANT